MRKRFSFTLFVLPFCVQMYSQSDTIFTKEKTILCTIKKATSLNLFYTEKNIGKSIPISEVIRYSSFNSYKNKNNSVITTPKSNSDESNKTQNNKTTAIIPPNSLIKNSPDKGMDDNSISTQNIKKEFRKNQNKKVASYSVIGAGAALAVLGSRNIYQANHPSVSNGLMKNVNSTTNGYFDSYNVVDGSAQRQKRFSGDMLLLGGISTSIVGAIINATIKSEKYTVWIGLSNWGVSFNF